MSKIKLLSSEDELIIQVPFQKNARYMTIGFCILGILPLLAIKQYIMTIIVFVIVIIFTSFRRELIEYRLNKADKKVYILYQNLIGQYHEIKDFKEIKDVKVTANFDDDRTSAYYLNIRLKNNTKMLYTICDDRYSIEEIIDIIKNFTELQP